MTYVEGFVVAVPAANKEAYRKHAAEAAAFIRDSGATRMVETWGDEVPDGKLTDFKGAVQAKPDEVVVFSWFEYPDRATRDAANEKMMNDPRMKEMAASMPFDGQRMIFGGFEALLVEQGGGGGTGYVDGALIAVPGANKEAYRAMAAKTAPILREYGATRVVETWGDDVPEGKVTDFRRAVKATGDEKIVYSWIEWPSKAARAEGWQKAMADPRMQFDMPFDGQRMIFGGFAPILDEAWS
ncbi:MULTISPECIES: DUF1428 domain-containing protein [Kaistia]|uniref:DUF1428 domain-containing protein n=1 Tax=Kaistia nematophila TaxID=2994654 RepID=A0A9X3DXI7_9HYPH|nr:DUF1428 domain-containing protein [Kaistia nematophila]MBN9024788.1 DUF1428 domain-containing protein [Hyphomicrobiales bacterium]MCX5567761.1 DUF1428 domain-containing protein [Kaistia nematophila]